MGTATAQTARAARVTRPGARAGGRLHSCAGDPRRAAAAARPDKPRHDRIRFNATAVARRCAEIGDTPRMPARQPALLRARIADGAKIAPKIRPKKQKSHVNQVTLCSYCRFG